MANFAVQVTETLVKTVIVEADDFEEAVQKVEDAYSEAKIVLDADDFDNVRLAPLQAYGEKAIDEYDELISLFQQLE